MNKTLYDIDYITIDLDKTLDNILPVELDIALFRDNILYRSLSTYTITIPYIKGTEYFFSSDFENYKFNQCDVGTLLMLGLVKTMSNKTKTLLDNVAMQNKLTKTKE